MSKNSAARYLDLNSKEKWYVVANRMQAVIYTNGSDHKFHLVERLSNPRGNLMEAELDSDRAGRGFSSDTRSHSLDRRNHSHEKVARRFAKKIGQALERAYYDGRFDSLLLSAEPHFLGLLREAMSNSVRKTVENEIAHLYEGSDDEIRSRIFKALEAK